MSALAGRLQDALNRAARDLGRNPNPQAWAVVRFSDLRDAIAALGMAERTLRDNVSDRNGGDALAATGEASQSGVRVASVSPKLGATK